MTTVDLINRDVIEAMKAKDKDRVTVLRLLKASLQNAEIEKGEKLNDEEVLKVLSREKKQRHDSIVEFEKAGRTDLVQKSQKELEVIEEYLPEELSDDELTEIINSVINSTGASSMDDFGTIMGQVMPKVTGRADGQKVNQLVREILNK